MGLFGPSWSWEEIQKKDALMGELKKENDRVLKKQQQMLNSQSDSARRESSNTFVYETDPRTARTKNALGDARIYSDFASGKYLSGFITTFNYFFDTDWIIDVLILVGVMIGFYILPTITFYVVGFFAFLVLCSYFMHVGKALMIKRRITRTECYQKILNKIKEENLDDILYIGINKSKVKLIKNRDNGSVNFKLSNHSSMSMPSIEYKYQSFGFPDLDFVRQSVFLGCLLKDLKVEFTYKIKVVGRYYSGVDTTVFSKEEQDYAEYDQFVCMYAYNKNNMKKVEMNNRNITKKMNEKRKNDLKNGKTW